LRALVLLAAGLLLAAAGCSGGVSDGTGLRDPYVVRYEAQKVTCFKWRDGLSCLRDVETCPK
jgi:hypothetical protein